MSFPTIHPSVHELANGHALLAASILPSRPYHSISAFTAAFNHPLCPMQYSSTRSSNRQYWNMVIAWALSWNVVHLLYQCPLTLTVDGFFLNTLQLTSNMLVCHPEQAQGI